METVIYKQGVYWLFRDCCSHISGHCYVACLWLFSPWLS